MTTGYTVHGLTQLVAANVATDDEVAIWDATAGTLKKITIADLKTALKPKVAILQNRQASGVSGGTVTSGAQYTYTLNVKYEDPDNIVSLYSNQFTLQSGLYRINGHLMLNICNQGQVRLYNVTSSSVQQNISGNSILGENICSTHGYSAQCSSKLIGTFSLSDQATLRVEYRVAATRATDGLGLNSGWGEEVYGQVMIEKLNWFVTGQ